MPESPASAREERIHALHHKLLTIALLFSSLFYLDRRVYQVLSSAMPKPMIPVQFFYDIGSPKSYIQLQLLLRYAPLWNFELELCPSQCFSVLLTLLVPVSSFR